MATPHNPPSQQDSTKVNFAKIKKPKGGGALKGLGESYETNSFSGTANLNIPLGIPRARKLTPNLSLSYDSSAGNGIFGMGFSLAIPLISRKTSLQVPKYDSTDTFVLSGLGDLVPELKPTGEACQESIVLNGVEHQVQTFYPSIEGTFSRIRLLTDSDTQNAYWEVVDAQNTTHIYGKQKEARLTDPADESRVFQWLLEQSYDAHGNKLQYNYKTIKERLSAEREAINIYCDSIQYGNYLYEEESVLKEHFAFELKFNYGTTSHNIKHAHYEPSEQWEVRKDCFSSFKSGFEIRTSYLCHQMSIHHHFLDHFEGKKILTKTYSFTYNKQADNTDYHALLEQITETGFQWNAELNDYRVKSYPPIQLGYTPFNPTSGTFKELEIENGQIPGTLERYIPVDFDRQGIPGILYKDSLNSLYWPPMGKGQFKGAIELPSFPVSRSLTDTAYTLTDIDGNGELNLLVQTPQQEGFYPFDSVKKDWSPFVPFKRPSNLLNDPNRKIVDLAGTGRGDILLPTKENLIIHPSMGNEGYADPQEVPNTTDIPYQIDNGPECLVTFLDLFGDGMSHQVRITNGLVECWPNLGYGKFGSKIILENAPKFPEFDISRLFTADLDGSGTADLIYCYQDRAEIFLNRNGNGFSDALVIPLPDIFTNLDQIQFLDLLGQGSDCLVFTKTYPKVQHQYYDFTYSVASQESVKPFLLNSIQNNLGASHSIHYRPSTAFYLEDRAAGRPWLTNLPFPVQLVQAVETTDEIAGYTSAVHYRYRDGYYDHTEKSFRGFGYTERWDAPAAAPNTQSVPDQYQKYLEAKPACTRSWFYIGDYQSHATIFKHYQEEFYQGDSQVHHLPDTVLDPEIDRDDLRTMEHVYQALNGQLMHEETYGLDENASPFATSESNYYVRQIQERANNRYPVIEIVGREAIDYAYERNPQDPSATHQFTLSTDEYGNVLTACTVYYGRRKQAGIVLHPQQAKIKITAERNQYNLPGTDFHIIGIPCESKSYEIEGLKPADQYFRFAEIKKAIHELWGTAPAIKQLAEPSLRQIGWEKTFFWDDQQKCPLPLRQLTKHALLHHHRSAVFSSEFVHGLEINGQQVIEQQGLEQEGGYLLAEGYYWNCGLVNHYYKEEEQAFFLPHRIDNIWTSCTGGPAVPNNNLLIPSLHYSSTVEYDQYYLLPVKSTTVLDPDLPLNNHVEEAINDYIQLAPWQIVDINNNIYQALYDPLGMVIVSSSFKPASNGYPREGDDDLQNYQIIEEPDFEQILNNPHKFLQGASSYFFYDLDAWYTGQTPIGYIQLVRDLHLSAPNPAEMRIRISLGYSDGMGREIEAKALTSPGEAYIRDAEEQLLYNEEGDPVMAGIEERWIVSGKTYYNNKGQAGLQYQSYFCSSPYYETQEDIIYTLPPPTGLIYDPLVRLIQVDTPEIEVEGESYGFFSKIVIMAWERLHYDHNDTVLDSSFYQYFMEHYPSDPTQEQKDEKDALEKASQCYNTPDKEVLNNQGQPFLTIKDNLGAIDSAVFSRFDPPSDPGRVSGPLFEALVSNQYIDDRGFLTPKFQPYTTGFNLQLPPDLEQYAAETREILTAGCLTTFHELDIYGRVLIAIDPRLYYRNVHEQEDYYNFRYLYSLTGDIPLFTDSADAGQSLSIYNIFGNPIKNWDARGFTIALAYDRLQRPVAQYAKGEEISPKQGKEMPPCFGLALDNKTEVFIYGEGIENAKNKNLFGQLHEHRDQAGILTYPTYTYQGLMREQMRQIRTAYEEEVDWNKEVPLETDLFREAFQYNALAQVLQVDYSNRGEPIFGKGFAYQIDGQLQSVKMAEPGGGKQWQNIVSKIDYDAQQQPVYINYGNGTRVNYLYYEVNRSLKQITTTRIPSPNRRRRLADRLQDIRYVYDPVGNITRMWDSTSESVFCYNQEVSPKSDYTYDPIYQLIKASGRQHPGLSANSYKNGFKQSAYLPFCPPSLKDATKLCTYTENYQYDYGGNLTQKVHKGGSACSSASWTRTNTIEQYNNRLQDLPYDRHGNSLKLEPKSQTSLSWNYRNNIESATQLERINFENDAEYYVYDSAGIRARKVTRQIANKTTASVNVTDKVYLGDWELKRVKKESAGKQNTELERYSLHISVGGEKAAIFHYWTVRKKAKKAVTENQQVRYQLGNLLGSVSLELDADSNKISYEEYFPYGGTAFIAGENQAEVKLKDYRYSAKERDDSTGLYYYGERYYLPWRGRWLNPDPAGTIDGLNVYRFVKGNPVRYDDFEGLAGFEFYLRGRIYNTDDIITKPGKNRGGAVFKHLGNLISGNQQAKVDYPGRRKGQPYRNYTPNRAESNAIKLAYTALNDYHTNTKKNRSQVYKDQTTGVAQISSKVRPPWYKKTKAVLEEKLGLTAIKTLHKLKKHGYKHAKLDIRHKVYSWSKIVTDINDAIQRNDQSAALMYALNLGNDNITALATSDWSEYRKGNLLALKKLAAELNNSVMNLFIGNAINNRKRGKEPDPHYKGDPTGEIYDYRNNRASTPFSEYQQSSRRNKMLMSRAIKKSNKAIGYS